MTEIKLIISFYMETVHSPNFLPAFLNQARSRLKKHDLVKIKKRKEKKTFSIDSLIAQFLRKLVDIASVGANYTVYHVVKSAVNLLKERYLKPLLPDRLLNGCRETHFLIIYGKHFTYHDGLEQPLNLLDLNFVFFFLDCQQVSQSSVL